MQMESLCRDPLTADYAVKSQKIIDRIESVDALCATIGTDKRFTEIPSIKMAAELLGGFLSAENDPKKITMRKAFVEKVDAIIKDHKDIERWWNMRREDADLFYFRYKEEMRSEKVKLLGRARALKAPRDAKNLAEKLVKTLELELQYYAAEDAIPKGLSVLEARDEREKVSEIHSEAMKVRYEFAQELQAYKEKHRMSTGLLLYNSYPW